MMGEPAAIETSDDSAAIAASVERPEAFAAVFNRHFRPVHRYLTRRVGSERAEDLAASTFVLAFEQRAGFRLGARSARPWLLGIAANLIRERFREDARELALRVRLAAETSGSTSVDGPDPDATAALSRALATLDWDQREVLLLFAWADLSYEGIAEALAIPVGTVRSRLSRARRHLREHLAERQAIQEITQGGSQDDR